MEFCRRWGVVDRVRRCGFPEDYEWAAARRRGVPVAVADIGDPTIAALYQQPLVLVRPDGHSCWRGHALPADPERLIDTIRGAA